MLLSLLSCQNVGVKNEFQSISNFSGCLKIVFRVLYCGLELFFFFLVCPSDTSYVQIEIILCTPNHVFVTIELEAY